MKNNRIFGAALCFTLTALGTSSSAAELTYQPLHPAFGGDPNYFNSLFSLAQTQNRHQEASSDGGGGGVPTINFPPITIDLGGVGAPATPEVPVVAETPATTAKTGHTTPVFVTSRNYKLLEINNSN